MNPGSLLLAVAMVALYVFLWIGAPILLLGWLRSRRQEAIQRQIALTDAIDARLGPIVSPVVTKPLWGPWRVRIAMPLSRPVPVGRILAIAHGVLSDPIVRTPMATRSSSRPKKGAHTRGEWGVSR